MHNFGNHVRALRKARGLSQEQLGERANVNGKYLGELERGIGNPSLEVLVRLADALEIDLSTLVGDELARMAPQDVRAEIATSVAAMGDDAARDLARMLRLARR